jgi:hypothetical protein
MNSEFRWSGGAAYDGFVGRWSRLVAAEFTPCWALPDDPHASAVNEQVT